MQQSRREAVFLHLLGDTFGASDPQSHVGCAQAVFPQPGEVQLAQLVRFEVREMCTDTTSARIISIPINRTA
jgi:hypothetical protein